MQYHEIGKTGMKVSSLSFGASSLGGVFHDIKEKEGIESVFTAIEAGMNFIDVSPYYGHYKAETVLGKALKDVPRDQYYLSTKVGRYGKDGVNTWDYSAKRAVESVYESMERLNIDFIDLINVHDIEFADLNITFYAFELISGLLYDIDVRHFFHKKRQDTTLLRFRQLLQTVLEGCRTGIVTRFFFI